MDKNTVRQLKIKTATLKRTVKDHQSYAKETKQLEEKLEQLKGTPEPDAYTVKKMEEQVAETAQMLPNAKTRIESALEDLKAMMSEHEENDELKATEDWQTAEQTLAEATAFADSI